MHQDNKHNKKKNRMRRGEERREKEGEDKRKTEESVTSGAPLGSPRFPGTSWKPLGKLLGLLGCLFGASRGSIWPSRGASGGSWALLKLSWRPLGASWGQLWVPHVSLFQTGLKSLKLVGGFGVPKGSQKGSKIEPKTDQN